MLRRCFLIFLLPLLVPAWSHAAEEKTGSGATTAELSADANRAAPNDLATATLYFQADDKNPAPLARQVNSVIAAAIEQAKGYASVKAKSAGTSTFPLYGKEGRRIEGWRMRSEIRLEGRDLPAMTELVGKLQGTLALSSLTMQPSPETRKSTADLAAADAIRAFQERARNIAATLNKSWRLRHLAVAYGGDPRPVFPTARAATFTADALPLPVQAGETDIVVTVSGTIELTD
ncbi:SIMPL domain-containing protein [Azoarcus sp. DN11]|uniref:SIMPL domain-containing protein n=1 Tax=Azoarcus sp. DN11 TaxID=356837 RepID=UPI000EB23944|nr:SIMPL domain-containing protein [Azoarcus sp. DN11]AYH44177.1 cyclic nucleotide-binding protein [Azoarcus sp. DN11]